MFHKAVVVFTARPREWILHDRGSRDWRLDPQRTEACEYLVCTQNRHNQDFGAPTAPHGAAFLICRGLTVVPSIERPDRWVIQFREYCVPENPLPNIWGKTGHQRYPVRYTSLEELGVDLARLPPFLPVADQPKAPPAVAGEVTATPPGLSEARQGPPSAPSRRPAPASIASVQPDVLDRFDALLAQLDRVPDLPAQANPADWDEHGLPR